MTPKRKAALEWFGSHPDGVFLWGAEDEPSTRMITTMIADGEVVEHREIFAAYIITGLGRRRLNGDDA